MSSLIPAFSPRRRSSARRVFGQTSGGIGRTVCRKNGVVNAQVLSSGERI
jgi:hypothetical protein